METLEMILSMLSIIFVYSISWDWVLGVIAGMFTGGWNE